MSDDYLDGPTLTRFKAFAGLSDGDWAENERPLLDEVRKGRLGMLRELLKAVERRESYSFGQAGTQPPQMPKAPEEPSQTLTGTLADYLAEHSRQWAPKTVSQNRAYLDILVEYFGSEKPLGSITKQDAAEVKKVLQALPASRNTKPELKNLPLREVIKAPNFKRISPKTINSHIQIYQAFFDWAVRHGHCTEKLFQGMKVAKAKHPETERKAFSEAQVRSIFAALTEDRSKLVRKPSHKWGILLGLYTGARLNEICQLQVSDVQREGEIPYLLITDEGDDSKRLKTDAANRKVPLHPDLIRLGFLDFVAERQSGKRLFSDFSYSKNGGYGRNLGRWSNETFLPKLGIKEPGLVFHSFRHTVATNLNQADVPEPIIKSILGHAQEGVTQEVYMKSGYTLSQLRDAIQKLYQKDETFGTQQP
ncbi:site-specific integrase [Pseudooceanicola marinus]|uniref:site-specific integrase n=1 Tax=Pseudooceanicola marinus TaxID=396013 RepID=UPI001CD3180C|nr:site-specific integrase [Pseudooceanicola marinus]MCA1337480.1 site-specific integrase [Pseudooceanicola marinus]